MNIYEKSPDQLEEKTVEENIPDLKRNHNCKFI